MSVKFSPKLYPTTEGLSNKDPRTHLTIPNYDQTFAAEGKNEFLEVVFKTSKRPSPDLLLEEEPPTKRIRNSRWASHERGLERAARAIREHQFPLHWAAAEGEMNKRERAS